MPHGTRNYHRYGLHGLQSVRLLLLLAAAAGACLGGACAAFRVSLLCWCWYAAEAQVLHAGVTFHDDGIELLQDRTTGSA
jgi:hypothetical protein